MAVMYSTLIYDTFIVFQGQKRMVFPRVVQNHYAIFGLHSLLQRDRIFLGGIPLLVTRRGTCQDVFVQFRHVVHAFPALGAADGGGKRLWEITGMARYCIHAASLQCLRVTSPQ